MLLIAGMAQRDVRRRGGVGGCPSPFHPRPLWAFLRYKNSSKIPCTKQSFFHSKFRKISLFIKVLKIGIFGRFLTG